MKKFILLLALVCGSFQAHATDSFQEKAVEKLLTVKAIDTSNVSDICAPDLYTDEHLLEDGLSCQVLTESDSTLKSKGLKQETYLVVINVIDGYTFHVADYYGYWGHSRVVTCLDGGLRGLQGISDNGVLMIQSTDVKWHKNYFEHKYPAGRIYSYPNKQVAEFK